MKHAASLANFTAFIRIFVEMNKNRTAFLHAKAYAHVLTIFLLIDVMRV